MSKKNFTILITTLLGMGLAFGQASNSLDSIAVYKGETPGTGPGVSVIKLNVGEEVTLVAKGLDSDGKEVFIAPTWKADKEIALITVEGKGRSIRARLKEAPSVTAFLTVVVIRDDGKKISTDISIEAVKK